MSSDTQSKVQARHLKRSAFLYVRQSSLRQVFENSESTKRQYDLRQRAISLTGVDAEGSITSTRDTGRRSGWRRATNRPPRFPADTSFTGSYGIRIRLRRTSNDRICYSTCVGRFQALL